VHPEPRVDLGQPQGTTDKPREVEHRKRVGLPRPALIPSCVWCFTSVYRFRTMIGERLRSLTGMSPSSKAGWLQLDVARHRAYHQSNVSLLLLPGVATWLA